MATKRKDPLDEYLSQTSLEAMGFTEETEEQRFARPKPPKTEPCPICGMPRANGPTCGQEACKYQYIRTRLKEKNARDRERFLPKESGRILPRVDDIVCEAEVVSETKRKR